MAEPSIDVSEWFLDPTEPPIIPPAPPIPPAPLIQPDHELFKFPTSSSNQCLWHPNLFELHPAISAVTDPHLSPSPVHARAPFIPPNFPSRLKKPPEPSTPLPHLRLATPHPSSSCYPRLSPPVQPVISKPLHRTSLSQHCKTERTPILHYNHLHQKISPNAPSSPPVPHNDSRQRHNQMMRQNRSRFNDKFKELTDLLDALKRPGVQYKPMKNKIQTLERAIFQYTHMESSRVRFENDLLFTPQNPHLLISQYVSVFSNAPSLSDACADLVCHMCAAHQWKFGEVWLCNSTTANSQHPVADVNFQLCTNVIAKNNMPSTRHSLRVFSDATKTQPIDPLLPQISSLNHAVWIPRLSAKQGTSNRALQAKEAGITTMISIPVVLNKSYVTPPDAIITLMHVNDDLLSFSGEVRPYDADSITKLTSMVGAIVSCWSKVSC